MTRSPPPCNHLPCNSNATYPPHHRADLRIHRINERGYARSEAQILSSGKDTRAGKFSSNEFFKDLKIRTVNIAEAGK